jgi:hypothetical protein
MYALVITFILAGSGIHSVVLDNYRNLETCLQAAKAATGSIDNKTYSFGTCIRRD